MIRKTLLAASFAATFSTGVLPAVTQEEARQLGTTLTGVGAEKAGNRDGTIPAYAGGLTAPPASYQKGSGIRPDPFVDQKPRLVIDGKNYTQHADKLTGGTQELFKRYPNTMRMDIYPTQRTVAFPKRILDNTLKNTTGANSVDEGLGMENVLPGYPFPIPKSGNEAMWNHLLRYSAVAYQYKYDNWNVDSAGVPTLAVTGDHWDEFPVYDPKRTNERLQPKDGIWNIGVRFTAPARRAGEAVMALDSVNPLAQPRRAYQYLPGQRRVKLAPAIAYDTPNPGVAGIATYDDAFVFNGAMDRYDFKLVGKKEMYIPYNGYRLAYAKNPADVTKPGHINPDLVRWELHRVWVVEATLKPGKRHIYAKRVFYLDEDSWMAVASDQYDARNQLFVASFLNMIYAYDNQSVLDNNYFIYNFAVGAYTIAGLTGPYSGLKIGNPLPPSHWTPESLAGAGVR